MFRCIITVFTLSILLCCSNYKEKKESKNWPIIDKALNDTNSVFSANFNAFPLELSKLPLGVFFFETGVLTVLEYLLSIDEFDIIKCASVLYGIPDFLVI